MTDSDDLSVGDRIYDNDPRMKNRILKISDISAGSVLAEDSAGRQFRIQRSRIFTDLKWRKSGFSRVIGDRK